jgi:predicted transport protein
LCPIGKKTAMPIFKEENGKLKKLKVNPFTKEKTLQCMIEQNLLEVLDLHFLATEYPTTFGGRIDTIAVDNNGAPVIIEYKLNKNDNVINQALSYLRWLKAQKIEFFEMLVIKKLGKELADKLKIDWNNPRVICIAENYSKFDIDTVEVIPVRMELLRYRYYENGILSLESINSVEQPVIKVEKTKEGSITVNTTSIEDLLLKASSQIQQIFNELQSRILQIDENIIEKATSLYVAYRLSKSFAEIHIGKNQIKVYLRPVDYEDPLNKVEKIPESYNWSMDRRIYIKSIEELDYVMKLVEQSYNDII